MIGGRDSKGGCELFQQSTFKQIQTHPNQQIWYFGISKEDNQIYTFGSYNEKGNFNNL